MTLNEFREIPIRRGDIVIFRDERYRFVEAMNDLSPFLTLENNTGCVRAHYKECIYTYTNETI